MCQVGGVSRRTGVAALHSPPQTARRQKEWPVMDKSSPAIELFGLTKRYDATVALSNVSLSIDAGSVHALLGENGAGKSTAVKILSGLVRPDSGEVRVFGESVHFKTPLDSHRRGIQTAFQEMTLIPDLDIAQNILLPYEPVGWAGQIKKRETHEMAAAVLDRLNVRGVDLRSHARDLDLSTRQKIEIAKAVSRDPRILLLDEPTSALSSDDVDWLGELIAGLRKDGITVIFITHRMREVRAFCDRLSVLRNGAHAGTYRAEDISDDQVIELVIGRSQATAFPPREKSEFAGEKPVISGQNLGSRSKLTDFSFNLHRGEVLGIAGLQGMGQLELFLGLFGVKPFTQGTVEIAGKPVVVASPEDAVSARIGIGLVPEDRKTEGLFLKLSGRHNVTLPIIDRFTKFGLIDLDEETLAVDRILAKLQVHPRAIYTRCSAFSGGNQQKMAIGKWLLTESAILLLFDPTRGVDVGTKHEIYVLVREFVKAGGAVLFYSTEIPELVNLCDRVSVIYRGELVDQLEGTAISEEAILRAALGAHQRAHVTPAMVHAS